MRYRSYAKINLTLEVLGKREDGYHEIASIAHTISVADEIWFEPADSLTCTVEGIELASEHNLVVHAASLLATKVAPLAGAKITLAKKIPVGAGLGGGSSDAATALVALNTLWKAGLRPHELGILAAQLGSDVPFFVRGGAARMSGRGEVLERLPATDQLWLTLIAPRHALRDKTARLYQALPPDCYTDGERTRRLAEQLRSGLPPRDSALHNAFAEVAVRTFPALGDIWAHAELQAGRRFHLSGTGPSLFALAPSAKEARLAAARIRTLGEPTFVARTMRQARTRLTIAYA